MISANASINIVIITTFAVHEIVLTKKEGNINCCLLFRIIDYPDEILAMKRRCCSCCVRYFESKLAWDTIEVVYFSKVLRNKFNLIVDHII